jgi:hypothetical protein
MREIEPDARVSDLLDRFRRMGGVVDFVVIDPESALPDRRHRDAAIFGMQTIDTRLERYARERPTPDLPIELFFRIAMQPEGAKAEEITFSEFMGRRARSPGSGDASVVAYDVPVVGFEAAFMDPPHGLGRGGPELYAEFVAELFPTPATVTKVLRWSTEWSNYFDAGHEWWGANLWTLDRSDGTMLWIGASTTD